MYNKDKEYTLKVVDTSNNVKEIKFTPDKDMSKPELIMKLKSEYDNFFKLIEGLNKGDLIEYAKQFIKFKAFDKEILKYAEKQLKKELGNDWYKKSLIDIEDITYNAVYKYCNVIINDDNVDATKYYKIIKKFVDDYQDGDVLEESVENMVFAPLPDAVYKEVLNIVEMYEEDELNSDEDIFARTEDEYATEMLEQRIIDLFDSKAMRLYLAENYDITTADLVNKVADFVANKIYNAILTGSVESLIEGVPKSRKNEDVNGSSYVGRPINELLKALGVDGFDIGDASIDTIVFFPYIDEAEDSYDVYIKKLGDNLIIKDEYKDGDSLIVVDLYGYVQMNKDKLLSIIDVSDLDTDEDIDEYLVCTAMPNIISGYASDSVYDSLSWEGIKLERKELGRFVESQQLANNIIWENGYTLNKLQDAIKNNFDDITETIDICSIEDRLNGTSIYLARYGDGLDLTLSKHNIKDFDDDFENVDFIAVDKDKVANASEEEFLNYINELYIDLVKNIDNVKVENKGLLVEQDFDEAFYEKICRAFVGSLDMEWVKVDSNGSIHHGYFTNYNDTPNYNDDNVTLEDLINISEDSYEYNSWKDFYDSYVEDMIKDDINDIDLEEFYLSKDDLDKLGLLSDILPHRNGMNSDENIEYGSLKYICSSSDQIYDIEPELIYDMRTGRFVWINVNWEELDISGNKEFTDNDTIHIKAEPFVDEDTNTPVQEDEQKEFTDYEITMDDVEYFNNKENDIKGLVRVLAGRFYEMHTGKQLKAWIDVEFTPYEVKVSGELNESKKVIEKNNSNLYDELSRVLTDYEGNGDENLKDDPKPLYDMLVKIQDNWEDVITKVEEGKFTTPEQDEEINDFYQGIKVGDNIRINYTEDEDLADWLDSQDTDIFEVDWIEPDSGTFGIKGCDYGISMYTLTDFDVVNKQSKTEGYETTTNELYKTVKIYYKDLDSLCSRLQASYNDGTEFIQDEQDRLALGAVLDAFDGTKDTVLEGVGGMTEDYKIDVLDKTIEIENVNGDAIMSFKVGKSNGIYSTKNCDIADETDDAIRVQQISENY